MHAAAYPSPTNPNVSLPRLSILGMPPVKSVDVPTSSDWAQTASSQPAPALIVFGLDDSGKAHASWFTAKDAERAAAAAILMDMFTLDVEDDVTQELAGRLPLGKIFASGKAFVPFVKAAMYDALLANLPEDQQKKSCPAVAAVAAGGGKGEGNSYAMESGAATVQRDLPNDWSKIKVGSVVLASDGPGDGWYEADVIEMLSNAKFKLRWLEWPDLPDFIRPVVDIALLHPQHKLD